MHVGLFVTASQRHTVRPSKSFGAESGERDGLPCQFFPQDIRYHSGLGYLLTAENKVLPP